MKGLAKHVAALSLGVIAFAAPVQAQSPVQFSLGGSLGIPLGDFGDAAKTGWHALAGATFTPATLPVGIQVDANYSQFSASDEALAALELPEDASVKTRLMFATANAVYNFKTAETSRIHPYIIGGLGVYNAKPTGDDVDDAAESTTDFGINAGAGFNVAAGAASLFVEGRFHDIFTDGGSTQFVPLTVGLRIGGK
jgi:Outer membrane protein beta-barrel domain